MEMINQKETEKGGEDMEYSIKEFVAYSRKLLRCLVRIRKLLDESAIDEAKELLDELIEDTRGDIEA